MKYKPEDVVRIRGELTIRFKDGFLMGGCEIDISHLEDLPEAVMLTVESVLIGKRVRDLKARKGD